MFSPVPRLPRFFNIPLMLCRRSSKFNIYIYIRLGYFVYNMHTSRVLYHILYYYYIIIQPNII